jgi:hypothetical protein
VGRRHHSNALDLVLTPPVGANTYRRPNDRHWAEIVQLARELATARGLRVPVRIFRRRAPGRAGPAQAYTEAALGRTGAIVSATIWVDPRLARAAAIDGLLHELAHVICDQRLGRRASATEPRNDAEAHPREFWVLYGQLYNDWMRRFGH